MAAAEQHLARTGADKVKTPFGTFGWTNPNPNPDPKLDAKALADYMQKYPASNLTNLLRPYLKPTEPAKRQFYLR